MAAKPYADVSYNNQTNRIEFSYAGEVYLEVGANLTATPKVAIVRIASALHKEIKFQILKDKLKEEGIIFQECPHSHSVEIVNNNIQYQLLAQALEGAMHVKENSHVISLPRILNRDEDAPNPACKLIDFLKGDATGTDVVKEVQKAKTQLSISMGKYTKATHAEGLYTSGWTQEF